MVFHSPMARRTSTATTATPTAAITPPTTVPMPSGVEHAPTHWMLTKLYPIRAPQTPATRMAAKARARAWREGRAEAGRSAGGRRDPPPGVWLSAELIARPS